MTQIIGVKFKDTGKIYFFNPCGIKVSVGQLVVVETAHGQGFGRVAIENRNMPDNKITSDLKSLIRIANKKDIDKLRKIKLKEEKAFKLFSEKIRKHKLNMKLIDVEYAFDGSKIIFYFTSDERVDFRNLVRELAAIFKIRIELRQVGVRDETRMLGGMGSCGRPLCCSTFLKDFQPVSIKMAKEQGISLNPGKVSGMCSRLMCCLNYEQDIYSDLLKKTPKIGTYVRTPKGDGLVKDYNLLRGTVEVQVDSNKDGMPLNFDLKNISVINTKKDT